jgi:hypothetical protein
MGYPQKFDLDIVEREYDEIIIVRRGDSLCNVDIYFQKVILLCISRV